VSVFDGRTGQRIHEFFAQASNFKGGVPVAAGDVNGDGFADIIAGAGKGGAPSVQVFSGKNLAKLTSFFAYSTSFTGGVNVGAGDVNGDGRVDVLTGMGSGPGSTAEVKAFSGTGALLADFFAYRRRAAASGWPASISTATASPTLSPVPAPARRRSRGSSTACLGRLCRSSTAWTPHSWAACGSAAAEPAAGATL